MNGFEPLRRRIIDYTDAGQWSEVYDGPVEGCEAEQLKAENAKLRELVRDIMLFLEDGDYCTVCEKASDCDAQAEYDLDCLMRGVFHSRMSGLGIEVHG